MNSNMYDIFIAYNNQNKNHAKKLASYLDDNGFKVWFDYWNLIVGENIEESLNTAMDKSKIIFFIIKKDFFNKKWLKYEYEKIAKKNKKIIILIEKDIENYNLPDNLNNYQKIQVNYDDLDNILEFLQNVDQTFKIKYFLRKAKSLYENGKYEIALTEYKKLLRILDNCALGCTDSNWSTQKYNFDLYLKLLKYNTSNLSDIVIIYNNIASIYQLKGEYDKALLFYTWVLRIKEEFSENVNLDISTIYNNLGTVYQVQEEYDKALELYLKVLRIKKNFLEEGHPDIAIVYNNIASIYQLKGKYQKALDLYFKVLKIKKDFFGEDHLDIAITYNNIASIYQLKKEYDKTFEFYWKTLNIQEKTLGIEHPEIAKTYLNLVFFQFQNAKNIYKKEDYEPILATMRRSIKVLDSVYDKNHSYLINARKLLTKIIKWKDSSSKNGFSSLEINKSKGYISIKGRN